jgi:hypothetical protein
MYVKGHADHAALVLLAAAVHVDRPQVLASLNAIKTVILIEIVADMVI